MHTTIVTLKDGTIYKGPINTFRPAFNWFTIFGNDRKFCFDDCVSVVTPNDRRRISSPPEGERHDLMESAAKMLAEGREHGWMEDGQPYPKEKWDWEKRYEKA
jgi:hypothetical protein